MRTLRFVTLLLTCLVIGGGSAWADFVTADRAFSAGDHEVALRAFREEAKLGHARAQLRLGQMYANGLGVPQDLL